MAEKDNKKKQVPLRLSAKLYDAIAAWAEDDFRSVNGQIEYLLTECVRQLVARWLAGNIWGTSWHQVLALLPYMLILVPFLLTKSNILDILLLGENTAISLGIAVERELRLLLIASVALTSACVAVSGGIGFVGLVAPHMARRLIGGRHHALMPASMLLGALLLLLADTLGRSAFQPREIPVGIVISVLS